MITDETAFSLSFDALAYREKPLSVKIGNCLFSEKGIVLDIQKGNIRLKGVLRFHDLSPLGYDIMGPFAFVPFMQCRHRVYSMTHGVKGQITVGDQTFTFRNGTGYIEGDMGCSFPKEYIWTQCGFKNGSLMLSVADIPFLCHPFTGIVGVILLGEKKYRLATKRVQLPVTSWVAPMNCILNYDTSSIPIILYNIKYKLQLKINSVSIFVEY